MLYIYINILKDRSDALKHVQQKPIVNINNKVRRNYHLNFIIFQDDNDLSLESNKSKNCHLYNLFFYLASNFVVNKLLIY